MMGWIVWYDTWEGYRAWRMVTGVIPTWQRRGFGRFHGQFWFAFCSSREGNRLEIYGHRCVDLLNVTRTYAGWKGEI